MNACFVALPKSSTDATVLKSQVIAAEEKKKSPDNVIRTKAMTTSRFFSYLDPTGMGCAFVERLNNLRKRKRTQAHVTVRRHILHLSQLHGKDRKEKKERRGGNQSLHFVSSV